MSKKKFKRATYSQRRTCSEDSTGTVQIRVMRTDGGKHVAGNITRSFSIHDAKVSDVAAAIEKALFDQ